MRIRVKFRKTGFADCDISIKAKGFLAASFYWATEAGPLQGWSSFAVVPIEPSGNVNFRYYGKRAIPPGATHIYGKCISADFIIVEEAFAEIPVLFRTDVYDEQPSETFSMMSDLHLSAKPGKISRVLRSADSNIILIPGDLTNDGFTEQFDAFKQCIEESGAEKLVLSVTGNHDQLCHPDLDTLETYEGYNSFQKHLLNRASRLGYQVIMDASGAYSIQIGNIDIIGLQCVTYYRKFMFHEGIQLKWLEKHLNEKTNAGWHIIMCHAPLISHNPQRTTGGAYLSRDDELQRIIDKHQNIIFLSGHTHVSPNGTRGNVEYDPERQNLYIDDGSINPTELKGEALMPTEWKDGVIMELAIYTDRLEIMTKSIHSGIYYPRGYYRFQVKNV